MNENYSPPLPHSRGEQITLDLPNCGWIPLRTALDLYERLEAILREAEWPRLTVLNPGYESELDPKFGCPWPECRKDFEDVIAEDTSWRHTYLDTDWAQLTVSSDYDQHGDFEAFVYRCPECMLPVRLPVGWKEVS